MSTTNLRQIFHNLNIFGSISARQNTQQQQQQQQQLHRSHHLDVNGSSTNLTMQHAQVPSHHSHKHLHLPFSHNKGILNASMNSHHSRCSENSLRSSQHSARLLSVHRSRSRTRGDRASDASDCNSIKSHRRPSVDTVSTYLSHESKESLRSRNFAVSVNDLLDCSLSSGDEVFSVVATSQQSSSGDNTDGIIISGSSRDRAPLPPPLPINGNATHNPLQNMSSATTNHTCTVVSSSASSILGLRISANTNGTAKCIRRPNTATTTTTTASVVQSQHSAVSIVGVDPASDMISRFVKIVEPPAWPNAQPCPMCLEELVLDSQDPSISLSRCQHLMHLQCLNGMIIAQQQNELNKVKRNCTYTIQFLYKKQNGFPLQNLFIECPVCGIVYGEKIGNQPNGTMSWSIINKCLPGHEGQNTIQIIYE